MKILKLEDYIKYTSYVPVSKQLLYGKEYNKISIGARLLYQYIVDRWNLSKKNNKCNEKNEVYILFKQTELCNLMNVSNKTIKKYFDELIKYQLIYIQKQKLGKPNKIYLTDKINNLQSKKYKRQQEKMEIFNRKIYDVIIINI